MHITSELNSRKFLFFFKEWTFRLNLCCSFHNRFKEVEGEVQLIPRLSPRCHTGEAVFQWAVVLEISSSTSCGGAPVPSRLWAEGSGSSRQRQCHLRGELCPSSGQERPSGDRQTCPCCRCHAGRMSCHRGRCRNSGPGVWVGAAWMWQPAAGEGLQ